MQGLNVQIRFWQMNNAPDDTSGGAVITGTVAYDNIAARIEAVRPTIQAFEAGMEVNRLFQLIVNTQDLSQIFERDECEVISPTNHPYYQERMRILSIQHDSRLPAGGHTEFLLSRIEKAHRQQ